MADSSAGRASAGQKSSAADANGDHLPDGFTWHGYAVQLLHIGSSIEHALMVQYLYAAYSLDDQRKGLKEDEREKVARWRNLILSVAKEEMGHLITVQNVLCLLGGQMDLVRENYPFDSSFYPFRFRLEPLSLGSLACYVFSEMGKIPPSDRKFVAQVAELAAAHLRGRKDGKTPTAKALRKPSAHQVGKLYEKIIEILECPDRVPDSMFANDSVPFQASPDEWGRGYGIGRPVTSAPEPKRTYNKVVAESEKRSDVIASGETHTTMMIETVATRQQAVDALKRIAVQGEGHGFDPDSHFMRFRSIMKDFLKFRARDPAWQPSIHAVAPDPQIPWPDVPEKPTGNAITHPLSAKWGNMFNLRYRMLLTYLGHSFQLASDGTEARLRGAVIHRVFAEMYNLKAIAGILVRLPLRKRGKLRAGPPFQMPYTLAISMDPMDRWQLHRDLLKGALDLNTLLRRDLNDLLRRAKKADAELLRSDLEFLQALQELDCKSRDWIGKVMAGLAREETPQHDDQSASTSAPAGVRTIRLGTGAAG